MSFFGAFITRHPLDVVGFVGCGVVELSWEPLSGWLLFRLGHEFLQFLDQGLVNALKVFP